MPNDVYHWEAQGGLVHHCPECYKPLTTPQARSRCLGEHVECCKQYHHQLFKKGTSQKCAPCIQAEEQHYKRHREIAELVQKLKNVQVDQGNPPLTPRAVNIMQNPATPESGSVVMKRKDRKAAKKALKVAGMARVVTAADIEDVARVLRPPQTPSDDGEESDDAEVEDAEIKENLYFNKGTNNSRATRYELIANQKASKADIRIEQIKIDGILVELGVPGGGADASSQAKKLVADLRKAIEGALVQIEKERRDYVIRKAGFWRWASGKSYDRLMGESA